jgi:hypothetical protein
MQRGRCTPFHGETSWQLSEQLSSSLNTATAAHKTEVSGVGCMPLEASEGARALMGRQSGFCKLLLRPTAVCCVLQDHAPARRA